MRKLTGDIIDLGCGNGRLLQVIKKENPDVTTHGVDTKSMKFEGFHQGNIYDFEWYRDYELTLMSVERLFETEQNVAIDFLTAISMHSRYLLLSTYNEWKHGFDHTLDKLFVVVSTKREPSLGFEAKLLERK
jgi:hypothetical protein